MKKFTHRKRVIAITATATLFLGGGAAWAWFTSSGTGTGSVSTGHASNVTVTQDAFGEGNPAVALLPDGPAQPLGFTIHNGSSGDVHVAQVAISVAADGDGNALLASDSTPIAGCLASWYTITHPTITTGWEVTAGGTVDVASTTSTVTVALSDPDLNQNNCADKTVKLIYTAN